MDTKSPAVSLKVVASIFVIQNVRVTLATFRSSTGPHQNSALFFRQNS